MRGRLRTLSDKSCFVCNKVFRPAGSHIMCCSSACASIKRAASRRRGFYKNCAYCGIEFWVQPVHKNQKCCTQEHTILLAKKNAFRFNCTVCKKEVLTQPAQIKYRNRRHCSRECTNYTKRVQTLKRLILGGFTKHQMDRAARNSPEAIEWRKAVFARDDYTCQFCFIRGGYIEADHIKPFAFFPELRYDLSNGRTLCRPCHDKTKIPANKLREKWSKEIKCLPN